MRPLIKSIHLAGGACGQMIPSHDCVSTGHDWHIETRLNDQGVPVQVRICIWCFIAETLEDLPEPQHENLQRSGPVS